MRGFLSVLLAFAVVMAAVPAASASVVINEVQPWSGSTGAGDPLPSQFELYNADVSAESLGGWWARSDTFSVQLPDCTMPAGTYLLVVLGIGTDDLDFSDSMATYYAGDIGSFERAAGELGLYDGPPAPATIVDFVGWGQDTTTFGSAYSDAVAAGMWPTGVFVDITDYVLFSCIARIPSGYDTDLPSNWLELEHSYLVPLNPHNPIQLSPEDGILMESVDTLLWKAIAGVDSYLVEVDNDSLFTSPEISQSVNDTILTISLSDDRYFWRVTPLGIGSHPRALWSFAQAVPDAREVLLAVPHKYQHKDTHLLCIWNHEDDERPGCTEEAGRNGPWDGPHPAETGHIGRCNHCVRYCASAAIQMVNAFYNGSLTQDEISYHVRQNAYPGPDHPEGDLGHGRGPKKEEANKTYNWAMKKTDAITLKEQALTANVIATEITAGRPVITNLKHPKKKNKSHAIVICGFKNEHGCDWVARMDPGKRPGRNGKARYYRWQGPTGVSYHLLPGGDLNGRTTDPNVTGEGVLSDADQDGVKNFDEGHPDPNSKQEPRTFESDWQKADSDKDQVRDKQEIRSYTFHGRDHKNCPKLKEWKKLDFHNIDQDDKRPEGDCDSDNDSDFDGGEDIDGDGINPEASETCMFDDGDSRDGAYELWTNVELICGMHPSLKAVMYDSMWAFLSGQTFHFLSSYYYELIDSCSVPENGQTLDHDGEVESDADGVIDGRSIGVLGPGKYRVTVDVLSDSLYSCPDNWDPWKCFCVPPRPDSSTLIYNKTTDKMELRWADKGDTLSYRVYRSTTSPDTGFILLATVAAGIELYADPVETREKAFYHVKALCEFMGGEWEGCPSNTVGFVKIDCPANSHEPFGLPFTFWDVVDSIPSYGVVSTRPSDIIYNQLTGGTAATGDRCYQQGGPWAYRVTTPALWMGILEGSGMETGRAYWIHNRHGFDQKMYLAGEVDEDGGRSRDPIYISPNAYTPLSFPEARLRPVDDLNLLTSGFTGGNTGTSDRLIDRTRAPGATMTRF